ncbi:MAG: VWA domain-containing protein [Clostridia bacterium]|nr:VWA domain-containing protein [Clostridia bacterium]
MEVKTMAKKTTKENKNNICEMVFILDESGSMSGLESDTIGGFNSLIAKQKNESGTCFVTTVLFSDTSKRIHDRVNLNEIQNMTDKDYCPMGCTALYDTVGNTINHISSIHKYVRKEDVPAQTVFVIITDGYENASTEFNHRELKKLIESKKEKEHWEFMFIGANIDAVEAAQSIGIERNRAANYRADSAGTAVVFNSISQPLACARACAPMEDTWVEEIENDLKNR